MKQSIDLDIVCQSCQGTGLYVGMAERDGAAVVCSTCEGTGRYAYHFEYKPFTERAKPPRKIKSVHVARGYVIGHGLDGQRRRAPDQPVGAGDGRAGR
jgi:DnaJ-class molecular chaperone